MAIFHNPNLVTNSLICYIDINNKRCYDGTGLFSKNLANSVDTLSAVFETNYSLENIKKTLKNSLTERWGMNFNNVVTSQDFTIQFWINLKDYELPPGSIIIPNTIFFSNINTLVSASEIFYDGQSVTFNDIPLTYSTFDIIAASDGGFTYTDGKLAYVNSSFNPRKFTSSFTLSGEEWNFITFSKQLSTIKFFKNNISEEISAPNSATRTVTFNGIGGNNINFMSNHILVYNRALSEQEVLQNYNAFKNRYISEPYIDAEAIDYLNRANIYNQQIREKIYNFIVNLKKAKLWDSLVAGWLLSKDYNIGNGLSAISLKDSNTAVMKPGFNNTLPIWSEKGILFTDDGAGDGVASEGPRMEVPCWNSPNLSAPMSMTVVFATSANAFLPSQSYYSCLFGKTSYGWGAERNQFGFNVDHLANVEALMATYFVYDPAELPSRQSGTFRYKFLGGPNVFNMLGMSTDNKTVSTFLDNYTYATTDYFPSTGYIWDNRIKFDNVKFSGSFSGVINNREFRGVISSAFIFKQQINYKQFYKIYNDSFPEFNLPAFV